MSQMHHVISAFLDNETFDLRELVRTLRETVGMPEEVTS